MDPCDIGSEREQEIRDDNLAAARRAAAQSLDPTGRCHWCDEEIGERRIFCDADCADDYKWYADARKRNGR